MNKAKVILFSIVIILIATTILFTIRFTANQGPQITDLSVGSKLASVGALYLSDEGERAHVEYYSDDSAMLTIEGTEYSNTLLDGELSSEGIRYVNSDKDLVLWDKTPIIKVIRDEQIIFEGKEYEVAQLEKIQNTTWYWEKTHNGTGKEADTENPITPKSSKDFSLTFNADKTVNGTTDCNNFSGTYSIEDGQITFGPFMSTLMACEDSQEQEFISMIKDSKISMTLVDDLILENEDTIYFVKDTE